MANAKLICVVCVCVCFSEAGSRHGGVPAPPVCPLPGAPRPLLPLYQREGHPRPTTSPHRPQGGAHGETHCRDQFNIMYHHHYFWKSCIFIKSEKTSCQMRSGPSCHSCFPSAPKHLVNIYTCKRIISVHTLTTAAAQGATLSSVLTGAACDCVHSSLRKTH